MPFPSVPDLVDRALGVPAESVRLFMFDAAGRLHIVWERVGPQQTTRKLPRATPRGGGLAAAERHPPAQAGGAALAIVPVLSDDSPLGMLEVTGPASVVRRLLEALETVGRHAAVVLHSVRTIASARFQAGWSRVSPSWRPSSSTASSRSRAVRRRCSLLLEGLRVAGRRLAPASPATRGSASLHLAASPERRGPPRGPTARPGTSRAWFDRPPRSSRGRRRS